jgi:hypothetical protein
LFNDWARRKGTATLSGDRSGDQNVDSKRSGAQGGAIREVVHKVGRLDKWRTRWGD